MKQQPIEAKSGGVARLLIIDDEEPIRRALARYLSQQNFAVATAASGDAALELFDQGRFDLAVCDVKMPGMNGMELMRSMTSRDAELAVIMLTGANDAGIATAALTGGAVDYLVKPVALEELRDAVHRALHARALRVHQRQVERQIREEVAQRTAELEGEKALLRDMTVGIAEALVNAMEAKDEYLRGYSHGVAALAAAIADELRLPSEVVEHIRLAGRLHDVGRIGVRESVLNKVGTLTDDDVEHLRGHLQIGLEILAPLKHLGPVLEFIADHHEHWDGGGYPRALAGTQISIGGRVLAAADAFLALTSRRAYRDAVEPRKAIELMAALSGTLLDPEVFAALRRVVDRGATLPFLSARV